MTQKTLQKTAAQKEAKALLDEWLAGDKTEESFAAMVKEKTDDTASKETGGLYESVDPGEMVEEFNDWCFDESRKPGDVGMVETTYGYHIMFYNGHAEEINWKETARTAISTADYEAWYKAAATACNMEVFAKNWDKIN